MYVVLFIKYLTDSILQKLLIKEQLLWSTDLSVKLCLKYGEIFYVHYC